MSLFKFNIIALLLFSSAAFGFLDESCLGGSFNAKISHKVGPFSLLNNDLNITKDLCTLNIVFKKWSLFEKKWIIDYCRMPIHIKYGTGTYDILKRDQGCAVLEDKKERPDFCKKKEELENIISDEGLIFANGLKEDISSEHGKVYCTYLVLKSYLDDGIVYESGAKKLGEQGLNPKMESPSTPTF
jgi:hypothetical protein